MNQLFKLLVCFWYCKYVTYAAKNLYFESFEGFDWNQSSIEIVIKAMQETFVNIGWKSCNSTALQLCAEPAGIAWKLSMFMYVNITLLKCFLYFDRTIITVIYVSFQKSSTVLELSIRSMEINHHFPFE